MIARTLSAALCGVEPHAVTVTAEVTAGAALEVDGLSPERARELRIRVCSALAQCGVAVAGVRVTIECAVPIAGGQCDLAVAVAVATAVGAVPAESRLSGWTWIGELYLSGDVRPVRGVLPMLGLVGASEGAVVPECSGREAVLAQDVLVAGHLREVLDYLRGGPALPVARLVGGPRGSSTGALPWGDPPDLGPLPDGLLPAWERAADLVRADRGVLLLGPPGSGKTALARRLTGAMEPLGRTEALEIATLRSVAGLLSEESRIARPFRAPHHTCSEAGLVGGGTPVRPGEVSLAHGGVLFLDEVTEFRRSALAAVASAVKLGMVTHARASASRRGEYDRASFFAAPVVVAAANFCPCGRRGTSARCSCSPESRERYEARLGEIADLLALTRVGVERGRAVRREKLAPAPEPTRAERLEALRLLGTPEPVVAFLDALTPFGLQLLDGTVLELRASRVRLFLEQARARR